MPRSGRGGRRAPDGRPAPVAGPGQFARRTDLSAPAGTPPVAAPGLTYGARQTLESNAAVVPPGPAPGAPTAPGRPGGGVARRPPQRPSLGRESEFPAEAVTAGGVLGAGPGPEALGLVAPQPATLSMFFRSLSSGGQLPPDVASLATYAESLGL